jgi:hypothetical protein
MSRCYAFYICMLLLSIHSLERLLLGKRSLVEFMGEKNVVCFEQPFFKSREDQWGDVINISYS